MEKFHFDLKEAVIYQAVKWKRHPVFRLAQLFKKIFFVLFCFFFLIFLYTFLTDTFGIRIQKLSLGFSIIFLTLVIGSWYKTLFLNWKLKKPKLKIALQEIVNRPEEFNLAEFLNFEVAKAVAQSIKFAQSKNISEISSTILFYHLLKNIPKLNFIFSRSLLDIKTLKTTLEIYFKNLTKYPGPVRNSVFLRFLYKIFKKREKKSEISNEAGGEKVKFSYSSDFQSTILESLKVAQKKGHQRIEIGDVLTALAKDDLIFKKILIDSNLKVEDIENLTWWSESLEKRTEARKKFWEWKNLIKRGTLAKEWTAGYTITLDRFSIDLSEVVKKQGFPEVIGHKKEIKQMERILSRREINNVLIIGESGSGRKSMIQALTIKSILGESLAEVNYKKIIQLDLPSLLSQIKNPLEVAGILDTIFKEVISAGNIILVIDEFHNFVGGTTLRPGATDISGVLAPYLPYPEFQIVAITTFEGLHKKIEQSPALLSLFEKVEVLEISERETLMILENLALVLEYKYKKFISYSALRDLINFSKKYLPAIPFPEKAMDLLDEAMVYLSQIGEKILLPKHIAKIVSEKTQIPVGEIEIKERDILLNLENLIHQKIINQEEAVKEVSSALRRARAEVTIRKGPMGCFLFLGPTGVGKTETSKALAEIYFGSEETMIRLDMSEFQDTSDITRLIGSPGETGLLTTSVRENPFSLILLDEIEKAHPNILNLFLQVLDEGHLTDGLGRKVDFKDSIIIATSNAGYQIILEAIKERTEWSGVREVKEKLLDYLLEKAIFRPEFINRFDAVVVFKPLTKKNLLSISELMLQKIKKSLKEKDIDFIITDPLKEKIAQLSYEPAFGARQMKRVIQDKVENLLAQALLSSQLKRGDRVEVDSDSEEFKLKINS